MTDPGSSKTRSGSSRARIAGKFEASRRRVPTTRASHTPEDLFGSKSSNRLLKKGVRRRCERRGAGCKEARRKRCRGASERSADAADGPAPPQPLAVAGLLLPALFKREVFSAKGLSCVASCKRPDTTPASISQQPARDARRTSEAIGGGSHRSGKAIALRRSGARLRPVGMIRSVLKARSEALYPAVLVHSDQPVFLVPG